MKASIQRFIPGATTMGLVLIALLVFVNAVISEWNIDRLVENEHRVVHTQLVLTTLETVLSSVTQAETAERGFLITDNADYLKTFEAAIVRTGETLERLTRLMADDPQQRERTAA